MTPAVWRSLVGFGAIVAALPATAFVSTTNTGLTARSSSSPTVTYTAVVHIPVPPSPSANFPGASGGGDGWGVATSSTQVFNVFHHKSFLGVNCHNQSDATACWASPKTITDDTGGGFATSGEPGLYLDQQSGHLFVFATRVSDETAGVVCIDTTQPASAPNPFCGFDPLSAPGDAPLHSTIAGNISNISDPVVVGSDWYAFNYVNGAPTGTEDELLCFSLTRLTACANQPYPLAVGLEAGNLIDNNVYPEPSIAAFGDQVEVPLIVATAAAARTSSGRRTQVDGSLGSYATAANAAAAEVQAGTITQLSCIDVTTDAACAGSWPISTTTIGYPSPVNSGTGGGAAFPLLDPSGHLAGFCLPVTTDPCFSLDGRSLGTPQGLSSAVLPNADWDGPATVIGTRVYVPDGNFSGTDKVACYDFATQSDCPKFPFIPRNLGLLYTVSADPQLPACIWLNSDHGAFQIQTFDALTAGRCAPGPIRVLASSVLVPLQQCLPSNYSLLQVEAPPRTDYSSGSVQFEGSNGVQLAGIPDQPLDATGSVDLTPLNLTTKAALPQFLITLINPPANLSQVTIKLQWTGTFSPSCLQPGTTAQGPTSISTVVNDAATKSPWSGKESAGASAYDTSKVTGVPGLVPTGTVTYSFFDNGQCTAPAASTYRETLGADGTVPSSPTTSRLASGSYAFMAAYSGDSDYNPSTGTCEPFTVRSGSKPSAVGTVVDDTATGSRWSGREAAGASAYDTAAVTVARGGPAATGTVTYDFFTNGTCAGNAASAQNVDLGAGGSVPRSMYSLPLSAGSYAFKARYSGNSAYEASTGACEPFTVRPASQPQTGYRTIGGDGGVFDFHRIFYGSIPPPRPSGLGLHIFDFVAIAAQTNGYWLTEANGRVWPFGNALFHGSLVGNGVDDIVGIAATPDGGGYWLVGRNGLIYPFGDAKWFGSLAGKGVDDIVGIDSPDAGGYWLVASNGSVYPFGDAKALGSIAGKGVSDVAGMSSHDPRGYLLVSRHGRVFAFGDARYAGSCVQSSSPCKNASDIVGIAAPDLGGYWLAEANGNVIPFGDAHFYGRCGVPGWGCSPLARPIAGITPQ